MGKTGSGTDLYEVLGVPSDAPPPEIKRAFRALARECHPDVAGPGAAAAARFTQVREAYEVLSDPVQRARYDHRGDRRGNPFVNLWNRSNVNVGAPPTGPGGARRNPANDLDLEDIFNDFGTGDFGFTGKTRGPPPAAPMPRRPSVAPARPAADRRAAAPSGGAGRAPPQPGRDIPLTVDLPGDVAARGGSVMVSYSRLRRADDGRTLFRYDELQDLKIPPGTQHGETLRVPRMGDAGMDGGVYGDLVVDVRLRPAVPPPRPPDPSPPDPSPLDAPPPAAPSPDLGRMKMPRREGAEGPADGVRVDIGIVEALLGGRVTVETPGGSVRLTIPAGTSSGTRMRLRGRGPAGPDGAPSDLFAEVRIVVPKVLDEASRTLIERFAALNPTEE